MKPLDIIVIEKRFRIKFEMKESIDSIFNFQNKNTFVINKDNQVIGLNLKRSREILDFSFLEKFTYLTHLNLEDNIIKDFSFLNSLKVLSELSLSDNEIIDISFLDKLFKLKFLNLSHNEIEDISSLENLKNLQYLDLSNNNIKNIKPLSELKKIEVLILNENKIVNINFLKGLNLIRDLQLAFNEITVLNVFKEFEKLEVLRLDNNKVIDITPLRSIHILNLYLANNNINDLSPLFLSLKYEYIDWIDVSENPLIFPPIKIGKTTSRDIYSWFENNLENARERIKECKRYEEKKLDLGNCGLTDLSLLPELFEKNNHIQELILSNHYAMYDNDDWNKVESDGLNPNNISFIPNTISNLKALKILIVGGDWKQGKEWNRWRLKNVTNLMKLSGLRVLNISNNQIEKIDKLSELTNLESLHANNNELKKVENLGSFENLKEIYLSNNKLTDVSFLKDLVSVKTIDLHSNNIKDLSPLQNLIERIGITNGKWNINTINVMDNPLDEIFLNIINSINRVEREAKIENYFDRLKQGDKIEIKRIKLILLGNTNAGKTTLADILSNEKKAKDGSTHGVNFFNYKMDDVEVNGYDFGGQDYYHNTHYSFFDKKAIYLLICGNEQKDILALRNKDLVFPLTYWLGSLNRFAYENIVENFYGFLKAVSNLKGFDLRINNLLKKHNFIEIVKENDDEIKNHFILSKISLKRFIRNSKSFIKDLNLTINDIEFYFSDDSSFKALVFQNINVKKLWFDELTLKNKYNFISDFASSNFENEKINTENTLKKHLKNIILKKEYKIETQLNKIDYEISIKFGEQKRKVILGIDEIKEIDNRIKKYDEGQLHSLLTDLHGVLACYYFEVKNIKHQINTNLENIVIVNIEEFTKWIYQILDYRNNNEENEIDENILVKNEGYFTKIEAEKCLKEDLAKENLDYILAFMLEHKLIFKMKDYESFFVPNYLTEKQTKTEKLFLDSFQRPIIKYVFNEYFHTSILSEIISEYFNNLVLEETKIRYVLWKNKVLLYEKDQNKIVYISFIINADKAPMITISKFNNLVSDEFILGLCEFIEVKINSYDYDKLVLSQKGNYVPIEILENKNINEDNKISNIVVFDNKEYKRSDFKMFLSEEEQKEYPMKKVCISYSKEDLKLVNKFKDYLIPLSDDGLIEDPWYCTDLIAGEVWDETIKRKFDEAEIIFFMISENLMKTRYVKEIEIKNAIDKWNKNKSSVKIVPIILEYYHWTREGEYNLGKFSALPYMAKPVLDFKREKMAWFTVVEAVRVMIKKDLGSESEELSKEVKKIYERIVDGKENY